jgi:hypothetical protein
VNQYGCLKEIEEQNSINGFQGIELETSMKFNQRIRKWIFEQKKKKIEPCCDYCHNITKK